MSQPSENITDDYGWDTAVSPCSSNYIAPQILKLLRKYGARKVVDLGSGNGDLCNFLNNSGFDTIGVEHDRNGFEISQNTYNNIKFYNISFSDEIEPIIQENGRFDVAVSTEVIEHLYAPQALPIFAKRLLKDHGYLIITTPYHGYFKNLILSLFDKWDTHHTALWDGGHIKFWSRSTLTELLTRNGFEVVQFAGMGRLPYLWKSMALVAKSV